MSKGRRGFDEEFRREALRLAESGDASIAQVARDLGINVETLRNWRRKAHVEREGSAAKTPLSLEEENRRLKRENARLLEEREILKKATAFFARTTR
jgi:transposase